MTLRASVIRVKGRVNDIKRRLILPPGFRIFFLKRGGETKRFVVIREVLTGASVEYSDWRQQLVLEVAVNETLDTAFADDAAQASYWAAGVGYGTDNKTFDVYGVDPQRRDVVAPTAVNAAWKFFLTRDPKEKFILS
jgi:hypothetical protein